MVLCLGSFVLQGRAPEGGLLLGSARGPTSWNPSLDSLRSTPRPVQSAWTTSRGREGTLPLPDDPPVSAWQDLATALPPREENLTPNPVPQQQPPGFPSQEPLSAVRQPAPPSLSGLPRLGRGPRWFGSGDGDPASPPVLWPRLTPLRVPRRCRW